MSPLLSKGDKVIVIKPIYGARILNIFNLFWNDSISFCRIPGMRRIERNDVVVFNYPYREWDKWDKIEFQMRKYYVKRCIALPGDTLWISGGLYYIPKVKENIGDIYAQYSLIEYRNIKVSIDSVIPYSNKWTIFDLGPFYIPRSGDIIPIDSANYLQYKKIIEWECGDSLLLDNGIVKLGNEKISSYKFTNSYYFMGGDNVLESIDSRFWGLLPESFILGNASFKIVTSKEDMVFPEIKSIMK